MLLSSALSCESSRPQHYLRSSATLASPPASPPNLSTEGPIGNLFSTCRSLQSLISTPAPSALGSSLPNVTMNELPTPPMTYTLPPPLKLRLRSRPTRESAESQLGSRKRITKRAPARGVNKRRRAQDDDMGRDDVDEHDETVGSGSDSDNEYSLSSMPPAPTDLDRENQSCRGRDELPPRPSTPQQSTISPPDLPFGLDRTDFHQLDTRDPDEESRPGTGIEIARDGEAWSVEQDRKLIELFVAKFKLSQEDLEDCARSLGKGAGYVERRWKSLVLNGDIGLKKRPRRTTLHSTWGR